MPVEIERKFKVTDDGWRAMVRESREIADHLIARFENENGKARVRICEDTPILTIKGPKRGFSRHEHHIQLHDDDAKSLIETFSDSVPLTKIRHEVEFDGFIWQVDEYSGPLSGLVTCEIELPSEDAAFAKPPWVGEEITRRHTEWAARLEMCGRFTNEMTWAEIHALNSIQKLPSPVSNMPRQYNIAPTQSGVPPEVH